MNDLEAVPPPKANTFPAMLEAYKGEIARALPRHLNGDRMTRIALTAFRRNPKLAECEPKSVFAAVIQASQLGLEPDTLGRSYLIPYEKRAKRGDRWETVGVECQFVPGWKGLVELLNRSKQGTAWTGAVFEGDEFDYQLGDSPFVHHRPGGEDDPSLLRYVYSVGRPNGSNWPIIEAWPMAKVWKHRDRYNKVGAKHYSFGNEEMYARKVVLLQVLKYMPMSPELQKAIELETASDAGAGQGLTIHDAIAGTFEAPSFAESRPSETRAEQVKAKLRKVREVQPRTSTTPDVPAFALSEDPPPPSDVPAGDPKQPMPKDSGE